MSGFLNALANNKTMIGLLIGILSAWGAGLPAGPISRHDWFMLGNAVAGLLAGSTLVGRPDWMKRAINEPVIPQEVKQLSLAAEAAVARMQVEKEFESNASKKSAAALAVKQGTGVSDQQANLAVELAVLKGTGTGDGKS